MATIEPGLYQHYKGPFYQVMEVARHSETEESLVIYRALYGDKGLWARPLSMFTETIEIEGQIKPRFAFCDPQTEVLEVAILDVKVGEESDFKTAFKHAEQYIQDTKGYISHQLKSCVEKSNRYILLVNWQSIDAHNVGFRESDNYQLWKNLLHHFYDPFPVVEHYQALKLK